jgi:hypothetical protein
MNLRTSKEGVKLLKKGTSGTIIEYLYLLKNGMTIVKDNTLREINNET